MRRDKTLVINELRVRDNRDSRVNAMIYVFLVILQGHRIDLEVCYLTIYIISKIQGSSPVKCGLRTSISSTEKLFVSLNEKFYEFSPKEIGLHVFAFEVKLINGLCYIERV